MPRASQDGAGPSASMSSAHTKLILQHTFLQAIMQRVYLPEEDAKQIFKQIFNIESGVDAQYQEAIVDINERIDPLQFQLRTVKFPGNKKKYIGYINKEADENSKRAGKFKTKDSKPDVRITAFFRAMLESIACNEDAEDGIGWITTSQAHRLTLTAPYPDAAAAVEGEDGAAATQAEEPVRLLASDREAALAALVADGWLAHTPNKFGCYSLGVRSYLELGQLVLELELPDKARTALEAVLI